MNVIAPRWASATSRTIDARNAQIDGWRGISVLLVIFGHLITYRFALGSPGASLRNMDISTLVVELFFRVASPAGRLGVCIFFVISGFLITKLLIAEENRHGSVSLSAFYVRRFFRIVPAFALYFVTIYLLAATGQIEASNEAFVRSALYICNLSEFKCGWWFGHTWSLSVEEQFYLVWPLLFLLLPRRSWSLYVMFAALTIGAIYAPALIHFAHIAIGAMVASSDRVRSFVCRIANSWTIVAAAAFLLLRPLLWPLPALYEATIILLPILTAIVFFGTLEQRGPFVALINQRWLQFVGLMSYSLYLWQQLGTAPLFWGGSATGASVLYGNAGDLYILFVIPAVASYYLLERPLVKVGHAVSRRLVNAAPTGGLRSPQS